MLADIDRSIRYFVVYVYSLARCLDVHGQPRSTSRPWLGAHGSRSQGLWLRATRGFDTGCVMRGNKKSNGKLELLFCLLPCCVVSCRDERCYNRMRAACHRVCAVAKIHMQGNLEGFRSCLHLPRWLTRRAQMSRTLASCSCGSPPVSHAVSNLTSPQQRTKADQSSPELPSWPERSSHFTIINVINYVGASTTGTRPSPQLSSLLLCYCLPHCCVLLASCSNH